MELLNEVVISAEKSNPSYNFVVWDPVTGKTLCTFKEGNSSARCLSQIGDDYIVSGLMNKPTLKVWSLNNFNRVESKFICSGIVTALAITPCSFHAVGAINSKIHLWELISGDLMAILEGHFQDITVLKFTDDGSAFISGSKDGNVLVWDIREVLQNRDSVVNKTKPRYVWSNHTGGVTDIHIGSFGFCARVATVSMDQTSRLYDLRTGEQIYSVYTDVSLCAVTLDSAEQWMHLGTANGTIFQIELLKCVHSSSDDLESSTKKYTLNGHTESVTCLSTSLDGSLLLSGGDDGLVQIWKIMTKSLQYTFKHRTPVTNAFFTIAPPGLLSNTWKMEPHFVLKGFKRNFEELKEQRQLEVRLEPCDICPMPLSKSECIIKQAFVEGSSEAGTVLKNCVEQERNDLQQVNKQMYMYSMNALLNSFD